MTAADLAMRLHAKRNGRGWRAQCPAHKDDTPSLTIDGGVDGRILVHCHAGCSHEAILAAVGLRSGDLFPASAPRAGRPELLATYEYRTAEGQPAFEVRKFLDVASGGGRTKTFRPFLPGRDRPGLDGHPLVLYRLPELLQRPEGAVVFVVEGEKDVDRLVDQGLTATTNPFGAEKWRPEFSACLRGADVIILPDNDDPGRRHADQVARALWGTAARVRVVELPGLAPKGDVSDWLDAGHSIDDLQRFADLAPDWNPAAGPVVLAGGPESHPDETALPDPVRLADVTATPLEFAIDGLLVQREVNAIVGDGGSFKSTLQLAAATFVAGHALAFDTFGLTPGPVLIVSGEDGRDVIKNRIEAIARGHRLDVEAVLANMYVYDEGPDIDDPRWQLRLEQAANDVHAVLACFDPLVDLCGHGVEENSNSDAKRVTRWLRRFIRETGATPWLSHHVTKPSEGRTDRKHRVRGASAWKNATRACWWAEPCDGGVELDPIKANRLARPEILRLKTTIVSDANKPLMWKSAHFGIDRDGELVHRSVVAILRHVGAAKAPPSLREIEGASDIHGLSRDAARDAVAVGKAKGWLTTTPGPRRSLLHSITESGRVRLVLGND
ncbi:MAG: hypothetical protein FJ206_13145 [Gemmatimonadetes bacterium]|nr:hypothetical protein [Gemmatimonadota bacterium]